jgi:multidrug resistance efflux pump
VVIAVLAALGFGGAYVVYSRNFVSTDNAQVDGNKIEINAPVSGVLVDWQGTQGNSVTRNQAIGRVEIGSSSGVQMPINSPENGTIAVNNAVNGEWVTAGTNLATAYDLNKIYVTARVDETDITAVQLGAPVDVSVGGFSGTPVTGVVPRSRARRLTSSPCSRSPTAPATSRRSPRSYLCESRSPTPAGYPWCRA